MDSGPCKKHDVNMIWRELSLEKDYEMDSELCKNTIFTEFCMNPALGMTMKWIRDLAKKHDFNTTNDDF